MQEEFYPVDASEVYGLVAAALAQFEEPAEVRDDGVWLPRWPSVCIFIERAMTFIPAPESGISTAWLDLTCMYNTALPFTAARTHVIGLGQDASDAIADAVENWRKGIAPALLSFIYGFLKGEADSWHAGEERALPAWSCICGPYVLRGDPESVKELGGFLHRQPMADAVREHLAAVLDTGAPFHTVSLYRAQTASGPFADVLIDNQQDNEAGELLKQANWPERLQGTAFVGARQFFLYVNHNDPAVGDAAEVQRPKARKPWKKPLAPLLFLGLTAAFTYGLHEMLMRYASALAQSAGEAVYTLTPASPIFYVPASVIGALLAAALMLVVVIQEKKDQPYAQAHGLDGILWRLVAGGTVIALFMGAIAYFAAHSLLQLTADEIVIRRMWSFETEHYPYSNVSALTESNDRNRTFSIHFKDAPAWTTRQEIIFPGDAEKQYLQTRTRLTIQPLP
jgi:hypothetical protein